jgi:hypothetical protein
MGRRSGSVGVGGRMASGGACARQMTQRAQSCGGCPGVWGVGCDPSSVWQIGTLPMGSALIANCGSEIVARRRTWHQTASKEPANPIAGFSLGRGAAALRSSTRHTRAQSIRQGRTISLGAPLRQAGPLTSDNRTLIRHDIVGQGLARWLSLPRKTTFCIISQTPWAWPQRKHAPAQGNAARVRLQRNRRLPPRSTAPPLRSAARTLDETR